MTRISRVAVVVSMLVLGAAMASAQIMDTDDVIMPETEELSGGELTPYFWVGAQAVASAGVDLNTGSFGIRNHADDTWASFNVALVDSLYMSPKSMEVGVNPNAWTGHLLLRNYTLRFNSWETEPAINTPLWLAEIQGFGWHFGLFSQAGQLIEGDNVNVPTTISSGDLVLYLDDAPAEESDFLTIANPFSSARYTGSALLYGGYNRDDLFSAYLTLATEGNATTANSDQADGVAGVVDLTVTPLGTSTNQENPITVDITANAIYGFNFASNPFGAAIRVTPSFHLVDYLVLTPVAAFEMVVPEGGGLEWSAGAGATLRLSGLRWSGDTWGARAGGPAADFFDTYYENSSVLSYAYVQAYASLSSQDDIDIAIKFEEPDGAEGFHENLGAMAEIRINNIADTSPVEEYMDWSVIGRISYDLNEHTLIPSLRAYLNHYNTLRLRAGLEFAAIPHASFEVSYSSTNLNQGSLNEAFDAGRVELTAIIKSDSGIIRLPRRMDDW